MPIICPPPLSEIPTDALPPVRDEWDYTPLPKPIPVTEQRWPEGTRPLVTVRCMTFNHERFIRQAIDGFLMQETTFPVQILVHDDASTDGTAAIVREYAERYPELIVAVLQSVNRYQRRLPLATRPLMRGKYEALCEGDDYWITTDKLQQQATHLDTHPQCLAIGARSYMLRDGEDTPYATDPAVPYTTLLNALPQEWWTAHWLHTATMLRRLSLIDEFSHAVSDRRLHYDLGINLYTALMATLGRGTVVALDDVTSVYRRHTGGIYTGLSFADQIRKEYRTRLFFSRLFPTRPLQRYVAHTTVRCCYLLAADSSLPLRERFAWICRGVRIDRRLSRRSVRCCYWLCRSLVSKLTDRLIGIRSPSLMSK